MEELFIMMLEEKTALEKFFKAAPAGTGIIAGGSIRSVWKF